MSRLRFLKLLQVDVISAGTDGRQWLALVVATVGSISLAAPEDLAKEIPATFDFASLDMKLPLALTTATRRWAIAADPSGKSYVLSEPGAEGAVGGATLLLMRLTSQADKDLAVQVVLNRPVMSRFREVWPDASSKGKDTYFSGYHRAIGRYRQPPDHEDGVLLLSAGEPGSDSRGAPLHRSRSSG